MLQEAHPVRREVIDIRRADFLLPVATEVADPEIIREDEDHIGLRRRGGLCGKGTARQRREEERGETVHALWLRWRMPAGIAARKCGVESDQRCRFGGAGKQVIGSKAAKGRQRSPKVANWRPLTNAYDFKAFAQRLPKDANACPPRH